MYVRRTSYNTAFLHQLLLEMYSLPFSVLFIILLLFYHIFSVLVLFSRAWQCGATVGKAPTHQVSQSKLLEHLRILLYMMAPLKRVHAASCAIHPEIQAKDRGNSNIQPIQAEFMYKQDLCINVLEPILCTLSSAASPN
jgi:hypothetical protein